MNFVSTAYRACIFLLFIFPINANHHNTTFVITPLGPVNGTRKDNSIGFLGVPFAKPPVGNLRFAPPQTLEPWTSPLTAQRFGPACPQVNSTYVTDEDCLYLNIFKPANASQDLPVFVWIHGGAFVTGTGSIYPGWELAEKTSSVVVTINYRLSVFGFLVLDEMLRGAPTVNFGLRDQRKALEWVHNYIEYFGGDKNRITLAGESAGGASVMFHLLNSELGPQLFHRAIMESPGPTVYSPISVYQQAGSYFSKVLGCTDATIQLMCLREKTVDEIHAASAATTQHALSLFGGIRGFLYFAPVIDGVVINAPPALSFQNGDFNRTIPAIIGNNLYEGRLFSNLTFQLAPSQQDAVSSQDLYSIIFKLGYVYKVNDAVKRFTPVYDAYAKSQLPGNKAAWYDAISLFMADGLFHCLIQTIVKAYTKYSTSAIYQYLFTGYNTGGIFPQYGSTHGSEIPFVFGSPDVPNGIKYHLQFAPFDMKSEQASAELDIFWENMLWFGAPGSGLHGKKWSPRSTGNWNSVMEIGLGFTSNNATLYYPTCKAWAGVITNVPQ